jgi:hypothetical protein
MSQPRRDDWSVERMACKLFYRDRRAPSPNFQRLGSDGSTTVRNPKTHSWRPICSVGPHDSTELACMIIVEHSQERSGFHAENVQVLAARHGFGVRPPKSPLLYVCGLQLRRG